MRLLAPVKFLAICAALAISTTFAVDINVVREVLPDASGITKATLTVDTARLTVTDAFTFTTRAYYYDNKAEVYGPTFVVQAGGQLQITLVNNLIDDSAIDATKATNTFRHSNTTNIHTHGLHCDPAIDSIFRTAPPGGSVVYNIPILSHHAPGLHWYHAHTHGSSSMQVMGGLLGAIYVQQQTSDNVPSVITSMRSGVMLMQRFQLDATTTQSCTPTQANFDVFKVYSFAELESDSGSKVASNLDRISTGSNFWTINGQLRPVLNLAPQESYRIKLVYAAGAGAPNLVFPSGCTFQNIAFDGVYFDGEPRTVTYLQLVTGSRVEIVVSCAASGDYTVRATDTGNSASPRLTGGETIFTIHVAGTAATAVTVPSLSTISRPYYLKSMLGKTITKGWHLSMDQAGHETCKMQFSQGSDCSAATARRQAPAAPRQNANCVAAAFTGSKGLTASNYKFTLKVGDEAEFTVYGAGQNPHPLHIHVNHFQIVSYSGADTVRDHWFKVGDWRDVIPVLDGNLKIRFIAADLSGETVMHCHILNHEDRGLMDTFLIEPSTDATTGAPSANSSSSGASSLSGMPALATALFAALLLAFTA